MKFKILSFIFASMLLSACSQTSDPVTVEPSVPNPAIAENDRNVQRKSDLQQLVTAIEFYKADNGSYPTAGGCLGGDSSNLEEMLRDYLFVIPPGQSGVDTLCKDEYFYYTYEDGATYVLVAELEEADGFETYREGVYCNIPNIAFFTDAALLSDLKAKLQGQACVEGQENSKFYVLMRDAE